MWIKLSEFFKTFLAGCVLLLLNSNTLSNKAKVCLYIENTLWSLCTWFFKTKYFQKEWASVCRKHVNFMIYFWNYMFNQFFKKSSCFCSILKLPTVCVWPRIGEETSSVPIWQQIPSFLFQQKLKNSNEEDLVLSWNKRPGSWYKVNC